jgi:hypothetical protein
MQNHRRLLPREDHTLEKSGQPSSRLINALVPRRPRQPTIPLACQSCQQHKVRCDGVRPKCRTCTVKGRTCNYEFEAGMSRIKGLRRKQSMLQEQADSFNALYFFLQSRGAQDVNLLLERIRNGASLESVLQFVVNENASSSSSAEENASAQIAQSDNYALEDELLSAASLHLTSQTLREGGECFLRCLGTMFPVLSLEELDEMIHTFEEPPDDTAQSSRGQIDRKKVACGELLAICAAGLQYDRRRLPSGSASICTPFYQKARLFLDHVIEKDQHRAMRMCLCLGMYNVMAKSVLAVAYTGKRFFVIFD